MRTPAVSVWIVPKWHLRTQRRCPCTAICLVTRVEWFTVHTSWYMGSMYGSITLATTITTH